MATNKIREEEVKNKIRQEFFQDYDATPILGDIDFAVTNNLDKTRKDAFNIGLLSLYSVIFMNRLFNIHHFRSTYKLLDFCYPKTLYQIVSKI